jgi:hypothetical protein
MAERGYLEDGSRGREDQIRAEQSRETEEKREAGEKKERREEREEKREKERRERREERGERRTGLVSHLSVQMMRIQTTTTTIDERPLYQSRH